MLFPLLFLLRPAPAVEPSLGNEPDSNLWNVPHAVTCLLICAREAAPARMSGMAMAIVSLAGWIGMGLGSYQAGLFYDVTASYLVSYANAAIAGVLNILVVAALIWYRRGVSVPPVPKTRYAPADRPAG